MNIRNLLQLKRAFKRNRIHKSASQEQKVLRPAIFFRNRVNFLPVHKRLFHKARLLHNLFYKLKSVLLAHTALPGKLKRKQIENNQRV